MGILLRNKKVKIGDLLEIPGFIQVEVKHILSAYKEEDSWIILKITSEVKMASDIYSFFDRILEVKSKKDRNYKFIYNSSESENEKPYYILSLKIPQFRMSGFSPLYTENGGNLRYAPGTLLRVADLFEGQVVNNLEDCVLVEITKPLKEPFLSEFTEGFSMLQKISERFWRENKILVLKK